MRRMNLAARSRIALIAALDRERAIGHSGDLLWRNKTDLQHLRERTLGHAVVMGRKTWDSLPPRFRPLPGRRNVVVTGNAAWQAPGAQSAASLQQAFDLLQNEHKVFVIGGGQLYSQALPLADELVLTEIDKSFEQADTYFPAFDRAAFRVVSRKEHTDADGTPFAFVVYERRS
jgi:dihydrofolate reductase